MTSVTLHAGNVTHQGTSGSQVGTGAIWDDGLDSTYTESDDTEGTGQLFIGMAPLDVLSLPSGATVDAVTVNLRAGSVAGTDTPARVSVGVYTGSNPPFGASFALAVQTYVPSGGWQIETGGAPGNFTHTFDSTDYGAWGVGPTDLVAALLSGAGVFAYSLTNSGHTGLTVKHRFYELSVTVDYSTSGGGSGVPILYTPPVTVAPPLRQWPRSDGLTSGARRGWPPPKSQQFSSRRGGGYL